MKINQKHFVILCVLLVLIIIVTGLTIDFKGYLGNILAEIAGLIISILVALLLVDRFTEIQRKKRWQKVRNLTHRSISHHLSNILLELFNHFPLPDHSVANTILICRDQPDTKPTEAVNNLIKQINTLQQQGKTTSEIIIEYFNSTKWDISQIRHDLIPRVIQSSDNQDLIDALVAFDDIVQDLQNAIILHKRFAKQEALPDIISLLENILEIYQHL
jgi:hypothetical protein